MHKPLFEFKDNHFRVNKTWIMSICSSEIKLLPKPKITFLNYSVNEMSVGNKSYALCWAGSLLR